MDQKMIQRINAVLDRTKEEESGLSIAQLGLVSRFRFLEYWKKLIVFVKPITHARGSSTILALILQSRALKSLEAELRKEFPDLTIQFEDELSVEE